MFHPHDGRPVKVHPYRRMMSFLIRDRGGAVVYFEQQLDLTRTLPWLAAQGRAGGPPPHLFHLVLHSLATVLHERERLNRFTVGHRTYQRNGVFLSFAAKKAMSDDAPLATVKRRFDRGETFAQVVAAVSGEVDGARSPKLSHIDRELSVLLKLPGLLLALLLRFLRILYAIGLAPRSLVDTDPMYTSAFLANLGSVKLDAAYHHLYEHGNCPLFVTIGKTADVPAVENGKLIARPTLTLRFTYDERVEDGLYCARSLTLLQQRIEDPASWIADAREDEGRAA